MRQIKTHHPRYYGWTAFQHAVADLEILSRSSMKLVREEAVAGIVDAEAWALAGETTGTCCHLLTDLVASLKKIVLGKSPRPF